MFFFPLINSYSKSFIYLSYIKGVCDAALVGGSQLILNCGLAAEYSK